MSELGEYYLSYSDRVIQFAGTIFLNKTGLYSAFKLKD